MQTRFGRKYKSFHISTILPHFSPQKKGSYPRGLQARFRYELSNKNGA
jgi:hypothetical protein